MTQVEITFAFKSEKSDSEVINDLNHHISRTLYFTGLIKNKAFKAHPEYRLFVKRSEYHFKKYNEANTELNNRNIFI